MGERTQRFLYSMSVFTLLLVTTVVGTVFYWLLYPYQPLILKDKEFSVLDKTVKRGETLYFVANYCRNFNGSATVNRAFINGLIFYVPSQTTMVKNGCGSVVVSIVIPLELRSGKYLLQNVYQYKVNPLRTVIVKQYTEEFEVL